MSRDEAVDTLSQLARYDDAAVAVEAVRALAQRGDAPSNEALAAIAAQSDDPLVRMKAKEVFSKL